MAKTLSEEVASRASKLTSEKRFAEALPVFYQAIMLDNNNTRAKTGYLYTSQQMCKFDSTFRTQAMLLRNQILNGRPAPPFSAFIMFDERQVQLLAAKTTSADNQRGIVPYKSWLPQSGKRIKVGYISSYFRRHALSLLIAEVLKMHNREELEIYVFSYGDANEDLPERQRIRDYADHFINLKGIDDARAAALIHKIGLQLLIDMNGFSGHIRPGILCRKPAPVQGLWMSYPNTTGAAWADFYISDRYIVESDEHFESFTEKVYRMSRCCWTYDTINRPTSNVLTRKKCGLPNDGIVLGNFNSTHKMSYLSMVMWMTILSRTKNTYLWTMAAPTGSLENIQVMAEKWGIDKSRIIKADMIPHDQHLGRFRLVDLVLDTFPCNGHTLSMDALWSCCPMITMAGRTPISRVASSALRTSGFDYLVTHSPEQYIELAVSLINNPHALQKIREEMLSVKETGNLFNQQQFVSELDSIYAQIWNDFKVQRCFDAQLYTSDQ